MEAIKKLEKCTSKLFTENIECRNNSVIGSIGFSVRESTADGLLDFDAPRNSSL